MRELSSEAEQYETYQCPTICMQCLHLYVSQAIWHLMTTLNEAWKSNIPALVLYRFLLHFSLDSIVFTPPALSATSVPLANPAGGCQLTPPDVQSRYVLDKLWYCTVVTS